MLDYTLELITQAAANSLFIFCFCNLIIVMILMGSKPGSNFDQESNIPLSMVTSEHANSKEGLNAKHIYYEKKPDNAPTEENKGNNKDNHDEDNDSSSNNNNNHTDEEDELRKRVEEFIAKVNKEWKAEMLRTSPCNA